ncbi:MAG: hypothetical protein GWN87_16025 [Desulfuromonadales bacterium]|nr:hypothetical protein [Desulfuromonadales bacterium]
MDRAFFATEPDFIPAGAWSHFYFGSEFCSWTFPDPAAIETAIATARQNGLAFSLVTPVLVEPFIPRLQENLAQIIPLLQENDEIIVSDLGTIRMVKNMAPGVELVIGRAVSGQKRGPRILDLDLNEDELEYFRKGSWYQAEAAAFLREQGIGRVELDNLLQGVASLPAGLAGTLHVPWAMVTSSRNCPFREPGQAGPCPGGCGEVMKLTTPQTPVPLYQAGNSQFLHNENLPGNLAALGIDRIVEHRVLPR